MKKNDDANSDLSWFSNAASENTVNLPEQNNGKKTILIVDDEKLVRDVWNLFLSKQGYRVLLSETCEEAIKLFNRQHEDIDLVILDLNMPEMGGIQCLFEIQKINLKTPVMITSGYILEDELNRIKKMGVTGVAGFIQKPVNFNRILEEIRKILNGR